MVDEAALHTLIEIAMAVIAGVSVVANDVGRIPLANPLLFELSEWSKGVFPRSPLCDSICQIRVQGFTNNLAPRAAAFFSCSIDLFQQSVGYGDHNFGHGTSPGVNIAVGRIRSNLDFCSFEVRKRDQAGRLSEEGAYARKGIKRTGGFLP